MSKFPFVDIETCQEAYNDLKSDHADLESNFEELELCCGELRQEIEDLEQTIEARSIETLLNEITDEAKIGIGGLEMSDVLTIQKLKDWWEGRKGGRGLMVREDLKDLERAISELTEYHNSFGNCITDIAKLWTDSRLVIARESFLEDYLKPAAVERLRDWVNRRGDTRVGAPPMTEPNDLERLISAGLSGTAMSVYLAIASRVDSGSSSVEIFDHELAELSQRGLRTVRRARVELVEAGFIFQELRPGRSARLSLAFGSDLSYPFLELVMEELARARTANTSLASAHEAYAVIIEELDEFWEIVRLRRSERDPGKMLKELVQIGAMAQRAAEDLGLVERQGGDS